MKAAENLLRAIAEGTASTVGEGFFTTLVERLAAALGVRWALVCELVPPAMEQARTLAMCADGELVSNFSYGLEGTPCHDVLVKSLCHYGDGVRELFPRDGQLVEMGAESYLGAPLLDSTGRPIGLLAVLDDRPTSASPEVVDMFRIFAARAAAELERLRGEGHRRLAARVFETAGEGIMVTDPAGRIVEVNATFSRVTGYRADEVAGRTPAVLKSGWHDDAFYRDMWASLATDGLWQGEIWNRRKNGEIYPEWLTITRVDDDRGEVRSYLGIFADISVRKQNEERLAFFAHHDPLTGLANRHLLQERLRDAIRRAHRERRRLTLMFVDLDHFKSVNDGLGHDYGDRLLVAVAERFRGVLGEDDTLARLGGDEFILLFAGCAQEEAAAGLAGRVLASLAEPFTLLGQEVYVSASIGICFFPGDGREEQLLLRNADAAMYRAKELGRNRFEFFSSELNARARQRLDLENSLRRGLSRQELFLRYQPIAAADGGEITGVEALVRWQHPALGELAPDQFITLAEDAGFIAQIGEQVLHAACAFAAELHEAGFDGLRMAVNLSAYQLRDRGMAPVVAAALESSGLAGEMLELEITESHLIQDFEQVTAELAELKALGVRLAIDDFGTGHSSLAYLKNLPVDCLKIDRSFIRDLQRDGDDLSIVRAIIALGHALGLEVLAEGVETDGQLEIAAACGCDFYQGFLLGRPMLGAELLELLASRRPSSSPGRGADRRAGGGEVLDSRSQLPS